MQYPQGYPQGYPGPVPIPFPVPQQNYSAPCPLPGQQEACPNAEGPQGQQHEQQTAEEKLMSPEQEILTADGGVGEGEESK